MSNPDSSNTIPNPLGRKYALIGKDIEYSFSPSYFKDKFESLDLPHSYELLQFNSAKEITREQLLTYHGLNVTIPYKEAVIEMLDSLTKEAEEIGAVNCIQNNSGELIGHNTDAFGFKDSIRPFLKSHHRKALILGTGGASKAIAYVLTALGLDYLTVSRHEAKGDLSYDQVNEKAVQFFPFIINTTPLGTHPHIASCPSIPYDALTEKNFLYDLVYNPAESEFLRRGQARGAQTMNGLSMLRLQAERSWEIWQSNVK